MEDHWYEAAAHGMTLVLVRAETAKCTTTPSTCHYGYVSCSRFTAIDGPGTNEVDNIRLERTITRHGAAFAVVSLGCEV